MATPLMTRAGWLQPGKTCASCPLEKVGAGFMRPVGQPHSGLVLVGEALGADEAVTGEPFVGAAGFMLNRLLRWMRLRRDHVRISNAVWCRPPGNDIAAYPHAIEQCRPYFLNDIKALQPTFPRQSFHPALVRTDAEGEIEYPPVSWKPQQLVIVALGEVAFHALTGWSGIAQFRGYVFWSDAAQAWVVPTYHPAYLLRGNLNQALWFRWDVEKALQLTLQPAFQHTDYMPLVDPNPGIVADYIGRYKQRLAVDPTTPLAIDVENPGDVMVRCGFSFGASGAETISFSWSPYYIPAMTLLLASAGRKIAWNLPHDEGALEREGLVINGTREDTMDAWHVLHSDLDKSLGEVATRYLPWVRPWKHKMKTEFAFYNAMDALSLWAISRGVDADLKADGLLWDVWRRHVLALRPALEQMRHAGVLVDLPLRARLSAELGQQLLAIEDEMQDVVPDDLKPLEPKAGFAKTPAVTDGLKWKLEWSTIKVCSACGLIKPTKDHFKKPTAKNPVRCPDGLVTEDLREVKRYYRQLPFVPSTPQLKAYAQARGHKTATSYQTGQTTMNEEAMVKLQAKYPSDPLYPLVLRHRDIQKSKSTYVDVAVGLDDRIHTRLTNKPSSLRLASEDPNMQNWPPGARQLIIPAAGCVFWKRDYSAIEAKLVGYDAGDPAYIRMSALGIHDFVHAWVLHHRLHLTASAPTMAWSDSDLTALFKEQKAKWPKTREMCKRIVHLSNYLGTADRIYLMHRDVFETRQAAHDLQAFYFELFPSIPKWHLRLCHQLEKDADKSIRNAFGYRHFYFAPFAYTLEPDGNWHRSWGEDAKRAASLSPQSNAAGIIREAAVTLAADPLVGPTMRLLIHDEVFGEAAYADVDAVLERARAVMEAPLPRFPLDPSWGLGDFLTIGTEGAIGSRWSEMKHPSERAWLLATL